MLIKQQDLANISGGCTSMFEMTTEAWIELYQRGRVISCQKLWLESTYWKWSMNEMSQN